MTDISVIKSKKKIKIKMTGLRFGRLFVIDEAGYDNQKKLLWKCLCDCGETKIISGNSLRRGHTKSCGCLSIERARENLIKRNTTHDMTHSLEYNSWRGMIGRCTNPNNIGYSNYGGRGITVCKRWLKFENFLEDMGRKLEGLTIERKNNELGYFKENCIWANRTIQNRNQRLRKDNKTGVAGVFWESKSKKFHSVIIADNERHSLGYFNTIEEAKIARINAEQVYW